MFWNKFKINQSNKNWEEYRSQRNLVTKLKKVAANKYFSENCDGGAKNKSFWQTIKPFLPNKGIAQDDIVIMNNDSIITDKSEICNLLNEFCVNIVAGVGSDTSINTQTMQDIEEKYLNHPSIDCISKHVDQKIGMEFDY